MRKTNEVLPLDHVTSTAEYKRATYHVTIPRKFSFEADCLQPEFWRNVSQLKAHDLLEIEAEDGSYDALCRVTSADRGFAVLRVLRLWKAPVEEIQGEAGSIGFIVGKGWTLFGIDSTPVATFVEEDQAKAALQEYREQNNLEATKEVA